jgi:hypothetical protein
MRIRTKLLAPLMAAALAASVAQASAAVLITVDKSAQRMSVKVDGVERFSFPVSTGKTSYFTPSGAYTAFRMEEDHYSKEWDEAPMPHSIFFTKQGHAIHGSLETKKLGMPASHGCVRLAPANAAKLFALVKEEGVTNTKVVIAGDETIAMRRKPETEVATTTPRNRPARSAADDDEAELNAGSAVRPRAGQPTVITGDGYARVPGYYVERPQVDDYTARMRRRYYEERVTAERPSYGQRYYPDYQDYRDGSRW